MTQSVLLPSGTYRIVRDLAAIGLPEVSLMGIHHEKYAGQGLSFHRHDGMEICYLTRGERIYHVNGHDYRFRGNEIFITHPGEIHGSGSHPHGQGLLYWMIVRLPSRPAPFLTLSARDAWPLIVRLKTLHRRFFGDRRLKGLFEDAFLFLDTKDKALVRLEVATRLILWLSVVIHCSDAESDRRVSGDIRRVLDHVDSQAEEPVNVGTMASLTGLSVSRFKAKFKDQVGMPPAEYATRRRVEKAHNMLKTGRSVTDVAYALGFSSSQYFATVFKRLTHRRPKEVKREYPSR